jgi:Lectin C-type domain/PEP-CTERM motif
VLFNSGTQTLQVYQVIKTPGAGTWSEAFTDAATKSYKGVTGHLATIRSEAENTVVSNAMGPVIGGGGLSWIGATDDPVFTGSAVGEGDWRWVGDNVNGGTPDSFWSGLDAAQGGMPVGGKYNNWNTGEPNDAGGEDYADMAGPNSFGAGDPRQRHWFDLNATTGRGEYLVEYDAIPLANFGNAFTNGHRYEVIGGLPMTVADARTAAQALPPPTGFQQGDLAKVDSAELQAFLRDLVMTNSVNDGGGYHPWIGASDEAVEGEWRWFDGTQFWQGGTAATGGMPVGGQYNNWDPGEPNDAGGNEDFVVMNPFVADGDWFDLSSATTRESFIVEWKPVIVGFIPGDFDGSHAVGAGDLNLVLNNWAATVPPVPSGWIGEQPPAGPIGASLLNRVLNNWGNAGGSGATIGAVPEPATVVLVGLALATIGSRRRSR